MHQCQIQKIGHLQNGELRNTLLEPRLRPTIHSESRSSNRTKQSQLTRRRHIGGPYGTSELSPDLGEIA
jgi:hypothetical protein